MNRSSSASVRFLGTAMAAILSIAVAACSMSLVGCSSSGNSDAGASVRIGTMPNEHLLPLWAAEDEGMFESSGIDASIEVFDSAQALSAAITAGEVDMAMVDVMRAVKLCEAGAPVAIEWITMGEEPGQGRFGVLAPADAPYKTLQELADYLNSGNAGESEGVGVAANTVPEYVFDKLCERDGIDPASIPTQEIASLPERYSLLASGKLAAAALPGSLLALGEASGLTLLADDSTGDADGNSISQSVMVATASFAQSHPEIVTKVAEIWDDAAKEINANPEGYAALMASKANLNEAIADSYPVSTYPMALDGGNLKHAAEDLVAPQIAWMEAKGYSKGGTTYDGSTGVITTAN